MKKLCIIRHAKSSWKDETLADFDRPLSKRGKSDAPFMGKVLKEKEIIPDIILSSPAKRARKTALAIAAEVGFAKAVTFKPEIYETDEKTLLGLLTSLNQKYDTVFLIGHNPSLNNLVSHFLEFDENIVTCGVVEIDFDCKKWSDINPQNAKLISFSYPKQFRHVACTM